MTALRWVGAGRPATEGSIASIDLGGGHRFALESRAAGTVVRVTMRALAAGIVTTYGLDDSAFGALEQRWTAWWKENYT